MSKPIEAVFFTNGTASHKWRIDGIAKRANERTEHAIYVTGNENWNGDLAGANIAILELMTAPDIVKKCHDQGAKVIYEADDAFIDTYGDERKNLDHVGDTQKEMTLKTLQECDAITVTNETLKQNYARFTDKPIYILPNYVDYDWYGKYNFNVPRVTEEVRIGWFGSKGHLEDLQMVTPALNRVLEKYPQTKFVYVGFGGMSSDSIVTEAGGGRCI